MASNNTNLFDTNHSEKIKQSRKFIKELDRDLSVCAVAHFDLTQSTKKMIKNQKKTITEMLNHNKICRSLIEENGGTVIKELGDHSESI